MLLSCQNISKSFSEQKILENISFHIEDYDKAAIVGINGAGKTTLLKIITGELAPDEGQVILSKKKTFGYLEQHQALESQVSIQVELLSARKDLLDLEQQIKLLEQQMKLETGAKLEALMSDYTRANHAYEYGGGYTFRSELTGVLKGLGFGEEEFDKQIQTLSGGQKTRVALGKLLLLKPDLLILDEPTNHLDLSSITWLETFLLNYKGAVLIVSHDRYFLDRMVNKVIELEFTKATSFAGNYSKYAEKKELLRIAAWKAYENQQQEIKHQEAVIEKLKSFNREKSIKRAESREKMLDKIEVIDKPKQLRSEMHIRLEPKIISGKDVLHIEGLSKSFGSLMLFADASIDIKRGEHVAILGDNGTGKTTLLKMINGLIPADTGSIHLGSNVQIGYYDQEHQILNMDCTLIEEMSNAYPTLTNTEIRNILAAFLFTGDDVFKQIKSLSGGERGRLSLAKLMLSYSNFLILDEPTNHLDMMSKEILEDALNSYTGTVLYISHDRYFINKTAHRILDLHHGSFTNYIGNYDYYLEKKESAQQSVSVNDAGRSSFEEQSDNKIQYLQKKEQQAMERKRQNALKRCEEQIEDIENSISVLEQEMALPENSVNAAKLQELSKQLEVLQAELESQYEKWSDLSE